MPQLYSPQLPKWLFPAIIVAALLLAWELTVRLAGSPGGPPAPTAVAAAIVRNIPFLTRNALFTLFEAAAGLTIAVTAAFLVASAFARSPLAHASFMPLVLAAQTVPVLAIAPLLAAAIGEGVFANVVVTAYLCWFPSVIAFTHGFLNVDPDRLALFEVHRATPGQTWRRLRLPGAAPALVAGIRTSAGLGVISAIVAEYGTLVGGIGATIVRHIRHIEVLPNDRLYALVVVASLAGVAFTEGAHLLARWSLRGWLEGK
jgi:NitT/TauT family transport system permease protein